ncbi:MAG: S-adenosylmethionine:tRNA ribosyltransferase-isomerase [Microscillaceae bacterium]|nr:S-adenosylmethionine:tRNA ribosyltransferase-isomerase [Microscillaceae bacterium]MDW8461277.1 S-adenosylmethionine:tRNA ribosyltransferase-isomerase [Cytophagales bacterium]
MPHQLPEIDLNNYYYDLPEERIAKEPLPQRDQAKLLVYKQGQIHHSQFFQLVEHLPEDSFLVFNDTKVIPARLYFAKPTGAVIEIFLLQPHQPTLVSQAMQVTSECSWKCLIGNRKRWNQHQELAQMQIINQNGKEQKIQLSARLLDPAQDIISFSWDSPAFAFHQILQIFGEMPLPPYLRRKATEKDKEQYQTVYSKKEGAVAAPTAGLHFTENVLNSLKIKGLGTDFITLHVSGGTFQPIKVNNVVQHPMHSEQVIFSRKNIENLLKNWGNIIAVGTTSMRALESLYWFGAELMQKSLHELHPFEVQKLAPYQINSTELPHPRAALEHLLNYMQQHQLEQLMGETEIFIFPSYHFQMCRGLITNYHLPATTLILLVAAFIGEDWRKVYQEALTNQYRFLSYGDSSLLLPHG